MKKTEGTRRIKDLETVIVWVVLLLSLRFVFKNEVLIYLALFLLLISLLFKGLTSRASSSWSRFSGALSQLNNWVILSVIFFVFLTPLALLYRIFVKNPLFLKKEKHIDSYFKDRNYSFRKEDFEKLW